MKNKKTFFLIALVFVLLIGGASLMYNKLAQSVDANQLLAQETASPKADEETAVPKETAAPENTETEEKANEQKIEAPDFVVFDALGNPVKLSDFEDKPIVLNFWASWCGLCQMEMPHFNEKYLEMGDDIHFVMINMTDGSRETVKRAAEYIADNEYEFPIYYDTEYNAAYAYGATSLPITFFIDSEGYVVAGARGSIDAQTLQRGIDLIKE